MRDLLLRIYGKLIRAYGPQGWWPGDTPFEVAVGAILTQRTNWRNAERAIANLKAAGLLDPEALHEIPQRELERLIRPAGFYRQKAGRLKGFLELLRSQGGMDGLLRLPLPELRERLLSVPGIGPETADSIALYAAGRPIFVVDAYTRRILSRLGLIQGNEPYGELQGLFHRNLPGDTRLFKEYHALLVRHGKEHCRSRPRCGGCPIGDLCPRSGVSG